MGPEAKVNMWGAHICQFGKTKLSREVWANLGFLSICAFAPHQIHAQFEPPKLHNVSVTEISKE